MQRNQPPHPPQRRHVVVDGISYSLESGRKIDQSRGKSHSLPKPAPAPIKETTVHADPTIMHPHHVTHPALPLPHHRHKSRKPSSISSVILQSLRERQDRRALDSALITSLLSPVFWLCAALPWAVLSVTQSQNLTVQQAYSAIRGLLTAPFNRILLIFVVAVVVLFKVWLIRHIMQLVSYAANLRRIDHRSVDTQAYGWQALAKSHRLLVLTLLDSMLALVIIGGSTLAVLRIMDIQSPVLMQLQSYIVYAVLIITLILLAIAAVHRTLARVMLAATNQSSSFLVIKSLGLTLKSLGRALVFGLFWMLCAGVVASLLTAIIWSTASYGQFTVGRQSIARAALTLLSTFLLYTTITGFTLWSQGYWSLIYHHLAHVGYPQAVSQFIVTRPHAKPRRSAIIQTACIIAGTGVVVAITLLVIKSPAQRFFTSLHDRLPVNISELVTREKRP